MGVSKKSGTPKSSISIGFSIINHPFWGTTIFGNTHMLMCTRSSSMCHIDGSWGAEPLKIPFASPVPTKLGTTVDASEILGSPVEVG